MLRSQPSRARLVGVTFLLWFVSGASCQEQEPAAQSPMPPSHKLNRLAKETSPYLRQHATNPVDWYPWGKEALERSKREDKPIFLSIGYSSCHWCHVMERECFEDQKIAALLNERFVCVKVDREERPDLDEIYMASVQAMTGNGGWPMSVWLTPDLEPFYGGTYFPPTDRSGLPGFPRVVEQLAKVWKERREDCVKGGRQLSEHIVQSLQARSAASEIPKDVLSNLARQSAERFDELHGGFATAPRFAPKFPHASELQALLLDGVRGNRKSQAMAELTLDRMAMGGMFDQVGYGFHRYSTDREWLVPHFEKMLYDNALLATVYAEASMLPGGERHADVAKRTLDYMLREMQSPQGGFWSSQDADSDGEEGRYFVWTLSDWRKALGEDAELAALRWGVTESGNWEGSNVLVDAASVAAVAAKSKLSEEEARDRLERARARLLSVRATRVRPATDDKALAAWNGMAISAFAFCAQSLGDVRHLEAAQRAASFVLASMVQDGRLMRSWRDGRAQGPAFLEDYGFVADSLVTLFEADANPRWLVAARDLLKVAVARFGDEKGAGFYFTSDEHESLLARSASAAESSIPSGHAAIARALLRCGLLIGDPEMFARGERAILANAGLLSEMSLAAPALALAADFARNDAREVIIAGDPSDARTRAWIVAARRAFPQRCVIGIVHDGNRRELEALSTVFVGKASLDGVPTAYVCRRGACEKPMTDPKELAQ